MVTCHESNPRMPLYLKLSAALALIGCLLLSACNPGENKSREPASADTYFPIRIGDKTLQLQLAITQAEQQEGLMFRKSMPKDHGMLFLSERPRQQGFWMKNTQLPLDIGYLDSEGKLMEVHKLFPYDETTVASRSQQILIAIETNRGWYAENDINPGAQLDMIALKKAITERGFSTTPYPFED